MILSRIFTISLGIFLIVSTLAYIFIDFRPIREQALEAYQKKRYFTVLELYKGERFLEEEDYALLALSLDGIMYEINEKPKPEAKIRSAESLRRRFGIDFEDKGRGTDTVCIHLDDPYFPYLKKHEYWYQLSVLAKTNATYFCNPSEINSEFLRKIIVENPTRLAKETSESIVHLMNSNLEKLEPWEINLFLEILHFLSSKENTLLFNSYHKTIRDSVHFRIGPGMENPSISLLPIGSELFCFDKDERKETIGDSTGYWYKCFSLNLFQSGWIFSAFLSQEPANKEQIEKMKNRFSNLEFYVLVDFDHWNERLIPHHFHGNYIRTEKVIRRGESGMRLYRPEDGKLDFICRKFSGRKNYFEIYYEVESSELPIPITELIVVQGGLAFPVFRVSVTKEAVFMNGAQFHIDRPSIRETLAIKITGIQGEHVLGTLIHKNKGVIQNLKSYPVEEKILKGNAYSWEICIPQTVKRSEDSVLLFGFRIGREE